MRIQFTPLTGAEYNSQITRRTSPKLRFESLQSLTSFYGCRPARIGISCSPPALRQDQIRQKQAPILEPNLCQTQSIIALQRKPSQLLAIKNSMRLFCSSTSSPLHHRLSFIHRKIHRYSVHHLEDIQHRINSRDTRLQSAQTRFQQPQIFIK